MDDEARAVDNTTWDGNAAMVAAGAADDPAAAFAAICAGRRDGDPAQRQTWALPHHKHAGDPPNAAGVRDSLSRISQAQGLTNREAAQRHLDAHMTAIHEVMMPSAASGRPPRDVLVRAMPAGYESDGKTLSGHFARFNEWTKIDSAMEGTFWERIAPGAFRETLATKGTGLPILFQHGKDPSVGDQPIAVPTVLREDADGAYYEARLLDGVPPLIVDGLRHGVYGSSFRFRVTAEDFNRHPKVSNRNPDALPERTVRGAEVYEFGPVTFPAYAGASATLRSMTDEFTLDAITSDPARFRELIDYIEPTAPESTAEASPHREEGRTTPVTPTTPKPKGKSTVEYVTREEKASRVTELKSALARQAVEYPGVLPTEAQTTWDAEFAELDTLERDIVAWDNRQARLAAYAKDEKKVERTYEPANVIVRKTDADIYDVDQMFSRSRTVEERDQLYRDNAMRSVETSAFPHPQARPNEAREHIASLVDYRDSEDKELARRILITGSPLYRRAFNKLVVGKPLTPEETRAAALAVTGTTTTGGYMVPYVFDPTIIPIGAWTSVNPFRAACRVETIVGGNQWTAVSATNVAAIYETEALVATEAGPTIGQPKMTAQRASAFVSVSYEAMQDRPDLPSELARLIQEGKDTLEENKYAVGTGATVFPFGMFYTGAFTNLDTITNNVTAIADTFATEAALPLRYRLNAAWFMSRATLRKWQAFETVYGELFNGLYYANVGTALGNSLVGNTGIKLLGYPVYEVPSAPHAAGDFTADGVIHTVFGDPKQYIIVDRVGMNVEVIPNLFDAAGKPTGQRGVFAMWRNTARPLIDGHDGMVSLSVQ